MPPESGVEDGPSDAFVDSFLTKGNWPKIGALTTGVLGGGVFAFFYGVVDGTIQLMTAPWVFVDGVLGALGTNIDRFMRVLTGDVGALWEPALDLELFQLPFGVVVLLLVFTVAAWGVDHFR